MAVGCSPDVATPAAGDSSAPSRTIVQASPPLAGAPPIASPNPWPSSLEEDKLSFPSIKRAVAFLKRNMDILIRLPRGMPPGIRIDPRGGVFLFTQEGQRAAQLKLTFGKGKVLILQYGVSMLDGCAPEDSVDVDEPFDLELAEFLLARG